jgi:hypothetical protein
MFKIIDTEKSSIQMHANADFMRKSAASVAAVWPRIHLRQAAAAA